MLSKNRLEIIKKALFSKPYIFYFIIAFIVYLAFNIWINQTYITFRNFFHLYKPGFYIPYIAFNLSVAFLAALNVSLVIFKINELKQMRKAGGIGVLGIFGGMLGGACPGCFAGLFPAVAGLIGISATLGSLPFYGLEIQALSIILLLVSVFLLTKDNVCKIEKAKFKNHMYFSFI